MRDTKKNMTRTTIHRIFIAALLLTFGLGQVLAVDYSPYKGKTRRTHGGIYSTAEAAKEAGGLPTMGFQSTSTMSGGTRSDAATPLVNGDGSVAIGAHFGAPSGPRKAGTTGPGTPGDVPNPDDQQVPTPIGDAVLPLLLLAITFAVSIYRRQRTSITK